MIYTSYFGRIKSLDPRIGNLVSIARKAPKWFKGSGHIMLAPSSELLWKYKQGNLSPESYRKEFMAQLEGLSMRFVGQICQGEVLLCWEGPGLFCHRHLVREWFKKYGFDCEEVGESSIRNPTEFNGLAVKSPEHSKPVKIFDYKEEKK